MEPISNEELNGMIADLSLTEEWPPRDRLCLAIIELRDLRKRWHIFARRFRWLERLIDKLSRITR